MKRFAILPLFASFCSFGSTFQCESEFEWLKSTFENNDAGFQYSVEKKGQDLYSAHNNAILARVQSAKNEAQCHTVLIDWLKFFRKGHVGLGLNTNGTVEATRESEVHDFDLSSFKQYLKSKRDETLEGIWQFSSYTVALKKEGNVHKAYILESTNPSWKAGQVKFILNDPADSNTAKVTFFMGDHSTRQIETITYLGNNEVVLGNSFIVMSREEPRQESSPEITRYVRLLSTKAPLFEKISENTVLVRIPSFDHALKKDIDAVIAEHLDTILKTENLIIDIRGNGGGSDASYASLLPILYTNPIRTVGVEYLSTELNNSRMLGFLQNPHFSEEEKQWAKDGYDILQQHIGSYINIGEDVTVATFDKVEPLPKSIGVLVDSSNGSTAEQFLLAAKQSKKVKLFGQTTAGVLDISNMYKTDSPSGVFTLHYSLTKSLRIPHMAVDGVGIQPDYYIDEELPLYEWTSFTRNVLETL
ncbi:peptidase S41 [Alteromonas portus]|uniref:Peptidase S41 n=1 Tax=Alteromonas portus TaxID=2565549 RepID=A0A4V6WLY6_9ALTE|nr:S41 family peptidase [Alteromonas portus]TKB04775.1 peptidase S41 [Alteromonas portus]